MGWDDDELVRDQYRTTANLETRTAIWDGSAPQDLVISTLRAVASRLVLDAGAGRGQLAERIRGEVGSRVLALDASPAMVEACRARGLDAVRGDVRDLPFAAGTFDAVVAAWMLYHVSPVEKAVAEFARVLAPGGTLIAITNGRDHLAGLWRLAGLEHAEPPLSRENGAATLARHVASLERHDVETVACFADRATAARYLASVGVEDAEERLPSEGWPRTIAGATTVFIGRATA
ncbi:MAG: hypothetical protein B7Z69_07820 [Actinobacteria bacterium 21-73-9]|nr:MAG: hypothetical protein B7Z69_07820 [Actinobacteria bacterium 21-73-9]